MGLPVMHTSTPFAAPRRRAVLAWTLLVLALLWPRPAAAQSGDEVVYYHTDAVGSVRMTTGPDGSVIERFDFQPFGAPIPGAAPTTPDVRQFAGKEQDTAAGLDYFGARYYAGGLGRFTSVDPVLDVEQALVDPQRWNRYAYARGNPLTHIDPDGRNPIWLPDAAFIAADVAAIQAEGLTAMNALALAGDLIGAGPVARVALRGAELARAGRFLEEAARLAMGLERGGRVLEGAATGAAYRVLDLASETRALVAEVKDRAYVTSSRQLTDLMTYAKTSHQGFALFIGESTRLSKPLKKELSESRASVFRYIDGKWRDVTSELLQ